MSPKARIQELADTLIDALYAQSAVHNDNAVLHVWQIGNDRHVHVDGVIDIMKLAQAVAKI